MVKEGFVLLTFSELPIHLATKDVEIVGRGCHVSDLHIAILMLSVKLICRWEYARLFVAKLQISFHSTRGMFGALTIVTVG